MTSGWTETSPKFRPFGPSSDQRKGLLPGLRRALRDNREELLDELALLRPDSTRGELLSSELLPLLDTCVFLERESESILAPVKLGSRGQPVWLWGVHTVIYREPVGNVLILGPGNYPLFLPIVQALHAWAAGNCVWLKSAPGSLRLHQIVQRLFLKAGGEEGWFRLLGEQNESYSESLDKVQKVVLVGSASTGRSVLAQAGGALVPAIAELSGWDCVFIHPDADIDMAARAVAFGLSLNTGRTCVAPRRVLLRGSVEAFESAYLRAVEKRVSKPLSEAEAQLVDRMQSQGCRPLWAEERHGPVLVSRVAGDDRLLREEEFGSVAVLRVVESDAEALELAWGCPYGLGATLFGPEDWAESLARKVPAQMVVVNDMIVPTADPRVPFGGSGKSGFGRMRGAEGLLEMTQSRVVAVRRSGSLDHLAPPTPSDDVIVENFMLMAHADGLGKVSGFYGMLKGIVRERIRRRRARRS